MDKMDAALKKHASENGEEVREQVKVLMSRRGQLKRVITVTLKTIHKGGYNENVIQQQVEGIKGKLKEIEDYDYQIMMLLQENGVAEEEPELHEQETESQVKYQMSVQGEIDQLQLGMKSMDKQEERNHTDASHLHCEKARLKEVKLPVFSGDQGSQMEFSDFFGLFEDLVGKHSGATKLLYLKAYLRGSALDLIKHLSNEDANYAVAVEFLKKEYLDPDVLIETHIRRLCELQTPTADFSSMRSFMNSARASVYELKALGYSAIDDDCLGSRIISFMLCEKLPSEFKAKLSTITKTDTPSTKQLLENYSDVIRSLEKMAPHKPVRQLTKPAAQPQQRVSKPPFKQKGFPTRGHNPQTLTTKSTVNTFQTTHAKTEPIVSKFKPCKLCDGSHSMLKCTVYTDAARRRSRLTELQLCTSCSGQHKEVDCPGKTKGLTYPCGSCGANTHITALCRKEVTTHNHLCLTSRQQGHQSLLPTTSVVISSGNQAQLARALIDHGSQCSYISKDLAENLQVNGTGKKESFTVKTCIGTQEKVHEVVSCEIAVTPNKMVKAEFLIDPDMDLKHTVPGTHMMIQELKHQGVKLADCFYIEQHDDTVDNISCLLGINMITHLKPLNTTSLGEGTAYEVQKGLILFGDPKRLVSEEKIKSNKEQKQTAAQSTDSAQDEREVMPPTQERMKSSEPTRSSHQHDAPLHARNAVHSQSCGMAKSETQMIKGLEVSTSTTEPSEGPSTSNTEPSEGPTTSNIEPSEGPSTSNTEPSEGPTTSSTEPSEGPTTLNTEPSEGLTASNTVPSEGPTASEHPLGAEKLFIVGQQQSLHQGLGSAHSSNCAQHVTGSLCPQQVEPIPTEDVLLESYLHTSNMHCSVHQASVQTSNTLQIVEPDWHKESNSLHTSVQKVSSAVPESECGETLSSLNLKSECQPQTSNSNKHQAQPRFQQAQPTQSALDGEKATSASAPVEPQSEAQTTNKQQEQTSTETQTQTQWTQTTNEDEDGYAELSPADEKVMEEFQREVELRDGRYYVKIPFYSNVEEVPENFQDAMTMVDRVYRSLKQRNLADKYSEVFQQQLHDGIIEEVDLSESKKRVFIPHHPVIKMDEQTTTKIRPVFNCSYKKGDKPSLNDACFPGLNLHTNMVELLHRFRTNKYILTADIERAFLQIYLKDDKDKDRFSFLWKTEDGVKAYRYCTILFGLNASPFILNHVLQLHIQQYPETETTSALKRSLYVDNFLSTTSQLDSLKNIYHESMEILREGGFNLRSWKSNHPVMLEMMEEESTMHKHSAPKEKTLGYLYSIKDDTMSLGEFELDDSQHLTKRQLLSNISKVFDPLCLTLPVTIKGRLLMKQVWQEGTDWDEEVSPEVQAQWEKLKPDFLALTSLSFPRQTVNMETSEPVTLHVFCDGSKSCFGVACYLQQEDKVSLVYSHSKLAPDKRSIPQTELLGVIQALSCISEVTKSLSLQPRQVFIWCDAQVVLEWLHSGSKTKSRFTINRLKEASEKKTELEQELGVRITYKYVSSEDNPADMVTRGLKFTAFQNNLEVWLRGPSWLSEESSWPQADLSCLSEGTRQVMTNYSQTLVTVPPLTEMTPPIINPARYSSLKRLHRVTAHVFRFINRLKHREDDPHIQAEMYWLKQMQDVSFQAELNFLREQKGTPPKNVKELNLFIDKAGLLRCKGRLSKMTHYSYAVLNPILLAKNHHLTTLLIRDQHARCKHLGIGTTLTTLRERGYWIPAGRQVVKRVIRECVLCKRLNRLAFAYPKLTDLPKERVRLLKPFNDTAIDYTGHVYVYEEDGTARKVYIVLYTCMAIRAVHLDLVPDLTVKSFIQSFRRFCSAHCVPQSIYTDNARYFLASQRVLNNLFLSDEFKEHLQEHRIQHKTIPVYASWVGGVYERQVKTIKQCLHKSVGKAKLDYFELSTHLAEIQNVVNSRPITYVSSELNDLEPLTPNKILKVHTNPRLQMVEDPDDTDPLWQQQHNETHDQLNEVINRQEKMIDKYRKMWYSQYLLSLRETTRDVFQTEWSDKIAVGDVVLIDTKDRPRIYWQMGRVIQLIHGPDGLVRQVMVKTSGGVGRYSLRLLHPLEIQSTHTGTTVSGATGSYNNPEVSNDQASDAADAQPSDSSASAVRPQRDAAARQRQLVKDLIQTDSL